MKKENSLLRRLIVSAGIIAMASTFSIGTVSAANAGGPVRCKIGGGDGDGQDSGCSGSSGGNGGGASWTTLPSDLRANWAQIDPAIAHGYMYTRRDGLDVTGGDLDRWNSHKKGTCSVLSDSKTVQCSH